MIIPMDILLHSMDIVLRLISEFEAKKCVTSGNSTKWNKLDYENEAKKELPYEKQLCTQFSSTLTALATLGLHMNLGVVGPPTFQFSSFLWPEKIETC